MKSQLKYLIVIVGLLNTVISAQEKTPIEKIKLKSSSSYKEMKKQYLIEQTIENIAENNEDENIDYTTLFDQLNFYYEHPINLNKKEIKYDLEQLLILNQFQISSLIQHKEKYGKFLNIYELQSLNTFSSNVIRKILPFVTINENFNSTHLSLLDMFKNGKNDFFIRYSRVLNTTSGQVNLDDSTWLSSPNSKTLGSPDNLYMRYRFKYQKHLSFGFTTEKDAGETFLGNPKADELFNINSPKGFDFYSAHFYLKEVGKIDVLAFGDYHIQLGQGLTFWSGLAIGKSSNIMSLKRNAVGIKPYSSIDENSFLRGGAFSVKMKEFKLLAFGSKKMLDANIVEDTSLQDGSLVISSFQASGIHTTIGELQDKDVIEENILGGELSYENNFIKLGFIGAYTKYNGSLDRQLSTYNQYDFNSSENLVSGFHYSLVRRNVNLYGESSRSLNGGIANIHGLMASLHPRLGISILYRSYGQNYQSMFSNAISEGSRPVNEKGLFAGIDFKLNNYWELSAYLDQFKFPWMKYQVSQPNSNGIDGFLQVLYHPSKKLNIYARIRHRNKPYNSNEKNGRDITPLSDIDQWNFRLNINSLITESIRIRNRVEYCSYNRNGGVLENGVLILQDVTYKPKESKLSFTARFALFDSDSYNSRIYSYENDVLYYFRIPAYYYQGSRTYLTLRYQIKKGIDLWLRWGNWLYTNRDIIGSGLNEIEGPSKTDVRAQLRFQF